MISEQAIIDPNAKITKNVKIGPGAIIGANVEIGEGCEIGPYSVIKGPTTIGKNNKIFQFSSIGDAPQDITYQGEATRLEIGDNNIIREYCMISRGTEKGGRVTRIGNDNFLMAFTHVAHDCILGNQIVMVNYSALSGHVLVEDFATIGAYCAVHQFCHVGQHAFLTRATCVTKDVLPYMLISGHTAQVSGLNAVGLKRRGFSASTMNFLRRAYKIIFRKGYTVIQAVAELEKMQNDCQEVVPLIDALNQSTRGIVR